MQTTQRQKQRSQKSRRTDNWAILLCTSRYYFNYRHYVNALSVYKTLKDAGFRDNRIIFLNSQDEVTADARNPHPGLVYSDMPTDQLPNTRKYTDSSLHVFFNESFIGDDPQSSSRLLQRVEVDYIGDDVSVDAFLRLLDGRVHSLTEVSKRLESTKNSNVLVYMTGHGGDEFFKFQDTQEMTAKDFSGAIAEMYDKDRFREMLVIIDTCQAATMCNHINTPNVYCIGGSKMGENSYAYEPRPEVGMPVTDRFTLQLTNYIQREVVQEIKSKSNSKATRSKSIVDLINNMDRRKLFSNPFLMVPIKGSRHPSTVTLADFFTPPTKVYKNLIGDSGVSKCSFGSIVNPDRVSCRSYDFDFLF